MNQDLRKQQQRYYALLNGAKRGLYAPKMYVKGSSCKLQHPNQRRPLNIGLGSKMSNNDSRGVRFTRDGKRWEVMFGHDVWDETDVNNNNSRSVDFSQSSLAKLNSAVHRPGARSQDQFNLLHGKSNAHPYGWNRCRTSERIIASGLSSFTGSARFNSSRLRSGHMLGPDMCPLQQESCWICSEGTNSKDGEMVDHKHHSTFPDASDILLERADTWRDRLAPIDSSLTRAPKAFQPKDLQSFKPEFTQPYRFTYFTEKTWK